MAKPFYQKYDMPEGLEKDTLLLLESVKDTESSIRKGSNEVTKALERNTAKLVYIALDVDPPEIVGHIPLLCQEKKTPYVYISSKKELGNSVGMKIGTAACVIVNAGGTQSTLDKLAARIRELADI